MNEPLKIEILDRTDTEDFEQLKNLLKEFTIETYIKNRPENDGKSIDEKVDGAIKEFNKQCELNILSKADCEQINNEVLSQINSAKKLIDNKTKKDIQTRYYILKDKDEVVAFQQAQLIKNKDTIMVEGWRNLAHAKQDYRKNGQVIDSKGVMQDGSYSKIIYDDIGHWFEENGVNYERTCTGVNMLQNIHVYISAYGFLPIEKNSKQIFLEKFTDNKVDKVTLNKVYKLYCKNRLRTEHKTKDEMHNDILDIPEFANLTEHQRSGLVQSFLKEDEKEFELSENRLDKLNKFIQENINNKRNGTNYELFYQIAETMVKNMKIPNRDVPQIKTPSQKENTINVAFDFFRSIDKDLYEQVKNIIDGKSNITFNMYKFDKNADFTLENEDGLPLYTEMPCVYSRNGKTTLYMPYRETVEDISLLVHELSHTFDFVQNYNPTRNILGEITPHCFSAMLSKYLVENKIASKEDMINGERGLIVSHYDDTAETLLKLELMKIKEQKGNIEQNDISGIQKKYGVTNEQFGHVLGIVAHSKPEADYIARYMIAQLVYPYYMEQYNDNPKLAIKNMKEYFEMIKSNNFRGSLEKLGIQITQESLLKLIESNNKRIHNLESEKMFLENGISIDEVMKKQEVDTQKLGQETIQEQKDTAYIKETEQELEELENLKEIENLELE